MGNKDNWYDGVSTNNVGGGAAAAGAGGGDITPELTYQIGKVKDSIKSVTVDTTNNEYVFIHQDGSETRVASGSNPEDILSPDQIKIIVGDMVSANTDGIDYDALTNTLKASLVSNTVTDSSTIDMTLTDDGAGNDSITAIVKVSLDANNFLEVKPDGLFVPVATTTATATTTITTAIDTSTTDAEKLNIVVDGVTSSTDLVMVTDLAGNVLGGLIKTT